MSYSWVPFYKEVAEHLLEFEDKQDQLLVLLRSMKDAGLPTVPLEDNQPDGTQKPLTNLDPFTFLANFSRVSEGEAEKLCQSLKTAWHLTSSAPDDFDGRVRIPPIGGASWFFASLDKGRKDGDVPLLWQLFRQALGRNLSDVSTDLLEKCLKIPNVGLSKLASGLYWLSPQGFLPLSGPILPYLKERGATFNANGLKRGELQAYRELIESAHNVNFNNVALNDEAWKWSKTEPQKAVAPLEPLPDFPLNQILYGPPGTGKTFNAIPRAVEIITGETFESRAECQRRFDELRREGRIGFVTFHQSFSYEEFIEGLRPRLDDEEGEVSYEVRDGVLKEMALRAIGAAHQANESRPTFDTLWEKFLEFLSDSDGVLRAVGKGNGRYQVHIVENKYIRGPNIAGKANRDYSVPIPTIAKIWAQLEPEEKPDSDTIRIIYGDGVYKGFDCNLGGAVLLKLQEIERETLPSAPQANFQNAPRFVLIIDEINRGNISKILGELITLLEDDKRLGKANELRVTLPVSLQTFALPPNLYILGTMNTADKSLALLDIALRRRFEFQEIRPNFSLLELKLSDEMRQTLETLNLRLEAALDREHCLGHAYFKDVETTEDFNAVFRAKIIPLLQEFFYNDWETLRDVLGESSKSKGFVRELPQLKGLKNRTKWRWWFDADPNANFSCLDVLTKNYADLSKATNDEAADE